MTVLERPAEPPDIFARWFAGRGWVPRAHQLELLAKAHAGRSVLLIAPTGSGKTLAGFLPSLVELSRRSPRARAASNENSSPAAGTCSRDGGLHTLYISPLKALAVDIARNLETPVAEMRLPIRIETRTGDTPTSKRQRQRRDPPEILLTTPEQVALLLASADAPYLFGSLRRVILDELHALVISKRGDLLSLGLARLFRLAPNLTSVGLSATVAEPQELARFMMPQHGGAANNARADLIVAEGGAAPHVTMLDTRERLPWAGHSARHALDEIYRLIAAHRTTLVFVNTRSQAEGIFQKLWQINDDNLAIALHHGSLDVAQRRKVEEAMARRPPARCRLHLIARSWRRLGRCRSRDQCRRAKGRLAAAPAHRPRQSPHGRAVEGRAGSGKSLRSARMPRRARRHRRERARHAAAACRRTRRAGAARARLRLRRAVPQR